MTSRHVTCLLRPQPLRHLIKQSVLDLMPKGLLKLDTHLPNFFNLLENRENSPTNIPGHLKYMENGEGKKNKVGSKNCAEERLILKNVLRPIPGERRGLFLGKKANWSPPFLLKNFECSSLTTKES